MPTMISSKIDQLRKKYPEFLYKNYKWDILGNDLVINFEFVIKPNIHFFPKIVLKKIKKIRFNKIERNVLNNLAFHLGLIEMLSYWKATCSPKIVIESGFLNDKQLKWWEDLIAKGMGQFFYENKINYDDNFVRIISKREKEGYTQVYIKPLKEKVLIPIGGGKDSVVTLEILKKRKLPIGCFSLNPTIPVKKIIKLSKCKNFITTEREIDQRLLKLNRKGFLNGHTPFSAYLAFLTVFSAILFDYRYIALSNERSSNEGNLKYLGKVINHQYSKSFEFEQKFIDYSQKYISPNVCYFSFLRPLYEIQISRLFSRYPKYFSAFLSCNEAFKTKSGTKKALSKWCGNCPKCLFVFASLYPFIDRIRIRKIFGQNLFRKINLIPLMEELIGERKFKPFECVGTRKESLIAFYLSWKKDKKRSNKPFLLKHFEKKILPKYKDLEIEAKKILESWNKENNLPETFKHILKESYLDF